MYQKAPPIFHQLKSCEICRLWFSLEGQDEGAGQTNGIANGHEEVLSAGLDEAAPQPKNAFARAGFARTGVTDDRR